MFNSPLGTVGTGASRGGRAMRSGLLSHSLGSSARRPWPARHGSGATGSDPMDIGPQRRSQRTPSPGRRTHQFAPGGPITASEWSDQVEWLQRQITMLSKSVSDHAHVLGQLQSQTLPAANDKIDKLAASVDQRFAVMDKRLVDGGNTVNHRLEVLSAEIRMMVSHNQEPQRAPSPPPGVQHPPVATQHFDVQTPPRRADGRHMAPELAAGQYAAPEPHPGHFHMGAQPFIGMHHQPVGASFNNQYGAQGDFGVNSTPSIGSPPPPIHRSVNHFVGVDSHGSNCVEIVQFGQFGPSNVAPAAHVGHQQPVGGAFGPANVASGNGATYQQSASGAAHHQSYLPKWSSLVTTPLWNSYPNGEWKIGKKGIGELPTFDGGHSKYSHWKNKLNDFCADTSPY